MEKTSFVLFNFHRISVEAHPLIPDLSLLILYVHPEQLEAQNGTRGGSFSDLKSQACRIVYSGRSLQRAGLALHSPGGASCRAAESRVADARRTSSTRLRSPLQPQNLTRGRADRAAKYWGREEAAGSRLGWWRIRLLLF